MKRLELGMIHPLLPVSIVLGVMVVGLGAFSLWAFINYQDQKNNTDNIVKAAVEKGKSEQRDTDEAQFLEREKHPAQKITGPEDLGSVTLEYPKTWSVYLDKSGANGEYQVYLHPVVVHALGTKAPYALRIAIEGESYDETLKNYQDRIDSGDLKASPVSVKGEQGTRLDGAFSKETQGSMVVFKVRDKTLRVFTESKLFTADFDNIVLKSLSFIK